MCEQSSHMTFLAPTSTKLREQLGCLPATLAICLGKEGRRVLPPDDPSGEVATLRRYFYELRLYLAPDIQWSGNR
jgi:hypothetical protein